MNFPRKNASRRAKLFAAGVAAVAVTAAGVAGAAVVSTPSNAVSRGHGINEFGLTAGNIGGANTTFKYTKGFFCDTSVKSSATTGCEAGATFKKAPGAHDTLFITVPLGFSIGKQECPANLICVDHPGTIDLTRLEAALKPLYPKLSDAALTSALKNFAVPGHDHFLTTNAGGKNEWWDVQVIGVTDKALYKQIAASKDYNFIKSLLKAKNKNVVGPIPTNLFLKFSSMESMNM